MTKSERQKRLEAYERQARPGFIRPRRSEVTATRLAANRQATRDAAEEGFPPRKEEARCCLAKQLPDGRPVLGFCSPECIRRPGNWALVLAGKPIPKGGVPRREDPREEKSA